MKKLLIVNTESGFVLVYSLVILVLLSLYGIWALNTSTSEMDITGSLQETETQFTTAEGGSFSEAVKLGFNLKPFYALPNPWIQNVLMVPTTDAQFDPGSDTPNVLAAISALDSLTWPWDNLLQNYNNLPLNSNEVDYRYLATFLFRGAPGMGFGIGQFSGYRFRFQASGASRPLTVEVGGIRPGP